MTPRPRKKGNKDLPKNLYAKKKGDRVYFEYKRPDTGKFTGFGTDKPKALAAANQLNQMLDVETNLVHIAVKTDHLLKDYLINFRDATLKAKRINGHPLSKHTLVRYRQYIKNIIDEMGHIDITELNQRQLADFLNDQSSAETHNKYRAMFIMIYKQIVSDGIVSENIAEKILKKDKDKVLRERLKLSEYSAIYAQASTAIQNAMELSLNALQRRADIQAWRFDAKKEDGFYYIVQSKTRKHGKAAYLRIPADLPVVHSESGAKTLGDIITHCRDAIACPYVIHEKRQRRMKSQEKDHMLQLSVKQISDGFAKARTATGLFDEVDHPPTFHELLSLSEFLRKEQGWTIKQIQTLRGHTSEKMTRHYLEGQEWTTVEVG